MNSAKKIIKEQGLQQPDKKEVKAQQKSRKNLILIIIGAIVLLGGIFVVCYTQLRPRAILTVEGPAENGSTVTDTVYYTDSVYDIYQMESMYNAYGMDWDSANGASTLSDSVKDQIMDDLKQREVLYMQAQKDGVTLDDTEKSELDTEVDEAVKSLSDEAKGKKGLSASDIRDSLEKKKIAEKEKQKIIDGFDIDDEAIKAEVNKDEFHQYTLQYYTISKEDKSADTASSDDSSADGSSEDEVKLLDSDTIAKEKSDMEALLEKAKTAEDFTKLITDSDSDQKDDATGISYGTENLLETNTDFADASARMLIKNMKNDEVSKLIETDKDFYIVKMINNDDPEAYDNEVKNKISSEENSQFSTYYNDTLKKQYKFKVQPYWKDLVHIGSVTTA